MIAIINVIAFYVFYTLYLKLYLTDKIKSRNEITIEYINDIIVFSGGIVDNISFTTNKGRKFGKGGGGGGRSGIGFDNENPRVIALGCGLGGHLHNLKCYYIW